MNVTIELKETSQKLEYKNIENTYTKGNLYCIYTATGGRVDKFPLDNIWRIKEDYSSD